MPLLSKGYYAMVKIAEYYGQRTDSDVEIKPIKGRAPCQFARINCLKLIENNKPVCCVRRGTDLWIVCRHRLCSSGGERLSTHQQNILLQVGKEAFGSDVTAQDVAYKKEVPLPIHGTRSTYHGDFILAYLGDSSKRRAPSKLFVEMQGGGETSGTGTITRQVKRWESTAHKINSMLSQNLSKVGIVHTNAWRRQQEQLLLKGNIASQSGYGIVLCVGDILYDYIKQKLNNFTRLPQLRNARWDFALFVFDEVSELDNAKGPIKFKLNPEKSIFTSFHAFSNALVNQGTALPDVFVGEFKTLKGEAVTLS